VRALALVLAVGCGRGATDAADQAGPTTYTWAKTENEAFQRARDEHKRVLIHFVATWAIQSVKLQELLREPRIAAVIAPAFVPLEIDVSDEAEVAVEAQRRYQASTIPAIVMVAPDGRVLGRIEQLPNADELRVSLERVANSR
jgi:thiol:disulfide interchange protein